jgi:cobalamin biosynthesis Mg chelatase CobN
VQEVEELYESISLSLVQEWDRFVVANQTIAQAQERQEAIREWQAELKRIRAEETDRLRSAARGTEYGVLGRKKGSKNKPKGASESPSPTKGSGVKKRPAPKKGNTRKEKLAAKEENSGKCNIPKSFIHTVRFWIRLIILLTIIL